MALEEPWRFHSTSTALASVMPWEWILENVLDLPEFPLTVLHELIGYIPHIEEPRCSRLLQKVALRYLVEIVATGKLNVSAIPLVRFLLKEQGVSDIHRIHSLKESFENDLILRIETEVVLANLRGNAGEGRRDWEAYEDALDKIFPEEICEPSRVKRRKELLAVLQNGYRGEPQKDLSEKILSKFPLEELLRDISHYVRDKQKPFETKFLDQLAKDLDYGAYRLSSTVNPAATNRVTPPGLMENPCGGPLVREMLVTGHESSLRRDCSARADCSEGTLGIVNDSNVDADTAIRVSKYSPTRCSVDLRTKARKDEDDYDHCRYLEGYVAGTNVSSQEDLRQEIAFRMDEVDKVASGLTNEINELMKGVSKFAEGVHKASCIPEVQSFGFDPQNAEGLTLKSSGVLSTSRHEVDMDIDDLGKNEMEARKHMNDLIFLESNFLKTSLMGDTNLVDENGRFASTAAQVGNDNVTADRAPQHITCTAKKAMHFSKEEATHGREVGKQGSAWMTNVDGNVGHTGQKSSKLVVGITEDERSQYAKTAIEKEVLEGKTSTRSEDMPFIATHEDGLEDAYLPVTGKQGGKRHSRVYLRRVSKDRLASSIEFSATVPKARLQADREGEWNAKCYLCNTGTDSQRFCCGCTVSVHENCLVGLSINETGDLDVWYCPLCSNLAALDAVRKANKELQKAKRAVRKVSERASKAKKRLASFLSARELSRKPSEAHDESGSCQKRIRRASFQEVEPEDYSEDLGSQPTRAETELSSPTVARMVLKHPLPSPTQDECVREDFLGYTSLETPIKYAPQVSAPDETYPPQASTPDQTYPAQTSPVAVTIFSREKVNGLSGLSPSPIVPSMPEGGKSAFITAEKEQSEHLESHRNRVLPLFSVPVEDHIKSRTAEGIYEHEETMKFGTAGSKLFFGGNSSPSTNRQECGTTSPGWGEGDGHEGDLEEVFEEKKNLVDGENTQDQAENAGGSELISDAPNVDATCSRSHSVYRRWRTQIPGVRRRTLPWTTIEEDVLKEAIKMYSNNGEWGFQWKRILEFGFGKFHKSRTAMDLKDKWRNMVKGVCVD